MNLILPLVIVVLILFVAGFFAVRVGQAQARQQRIMAVVRRNAGGPLHEESAEKQIAKQRADIARKLKEAGKEEADKKKKDKASLREMMQQAGIEAPVSRYWIGSAITAVVTGLLVKVMTGWPPVVAVFAAFTGFFLLPKMFLKIKAARRQKKFLEEFADALDASVRLLQAGMPITEAISMVAREYTGPLREEMMRMYENQKVGVSLGGAAYEMARRVPLPEVHMFATALQIQSETGSSLSEVLSNLSAVIRARFRLKRKVKALSQEAKSSAAIIGSLPVLVSLALYLVNEKYVGVLFHTVKGNWLLGFAVFWMCCGILVMRQMINFKV